MPLYKCSEPHYFFREAGRKPDADRNIELPEAAFDKYAKSHPGLLMPVPLTTQGRAKVVRSRSAGRKATAPRRRAGR